MKLDELLSKLTRTEATRVANCGKSASWHWYQQGIKRKVPGIGVLVMWADYLELSNEDFGELVRDANKIRLEILELLAINGDRRRIAPGSVLRRDLAREIAEELHKKRQEEHEKQKKLDKRKLRHLEKQEKQHKKKKHETERQKRLNEFQRRLDTLRSDDGDY